MDRLAVGFLLLGWFCWPTIAADDAAAQTPLLPETAVVATVGDDAITAGEVNRFVAKVGHGYKLDAVALPALQAAALEELVNRRLVLAYAERTNSTPAPEEIDRGLAQLKSKLASQHGSLADYLKAESIAESDLRRQVTWNLVWQKCLAQHMTQQRLESFFQSHHREFDGTELAVSHILLRPQPAASAGP